jgi:CorA-like Mg2+ transporter protein
VVTVIFLPLTFVTGFLGMNTADIRNMNANQTIFWAISLPLAVVTLSLVLLIAYNGDGIKERFAGVFSRKRRSNESYASRAMLSYSERKEEKATWPELLEIGRKAIPANTFGVIPSQRIPPQGNNLLINPSRSPFPLPPMRSTTLYGEIQAYPRVHRSHVDVETLDYFSLPWQPDLVLPIYSPLSTERHC